MKEDKNIEKTISLYKEDGFTSVFAKLRFWDAPFSELEKIVPKNGRILDLGCGDGIFANYLAITGPGRDIVGIELNKNRLKFASKGLKKTRFLAGDVLKKEFLQADVVTMVHLLHHLPSRKSQEILIKKVSNELKTGGKLIIAEVSERPLLKYIVSWVTDVFVVPLLFERKLFSGNVYYRRDKDWKNLLLKHGFRVEYQSLHKGKPFSHSLFIASKK